jgi:hypothetical protein
MTAAALDSATFEKLLAKSQPQPVHSEQDYDRMIAKK